MKARDIGLEGFNAPADLNALHAAARRPQGDHSSQEGPGVCRLPAGGRRIRTLGPPAIGRWFSLEFSGSTPSPRNPTSMPATFRCCIPVCVSVRPSGFPRRGGSPPKISCGRYVGRAGRRPRIAARHEFDAGRHPVPAQFTQSYTPARLMRIGPRSSESGTRSK
jgi:hypothetical protein